MNTMLESLIETGVPKIDLGGKEDNRYKAYLKLFSSVVCDEFFDIPKLPADKYGTDGFFYEIPYYDSTIFAHSGSSRDILVVYKIQNRTSYCPLKISVELTDINNYCIYVHDQSGERTVKKELFARENGKYYSQVENHTEIRLSELINQTKEQI